MTNQDKLKQILASVFNITVEEITNDSSPDTIENWDSLNHLNLVLALEEEFEINFTEEQTVEILNYELLVITLREQGIDI
ncbi:acyl carrier protein [Flavobacteriaceae bacterium]|nr:acyl carrier protein [Flavobacteriaceae bacterium]